MRIRKPIAGASPMLQKSVKRPFRRSVRSEEFSVASKFATSLLAIMLLWSLQGACGKVEELTLCVHEDRVPGPTATLITVATPSGNLNEIGFGAVQAFSNTLRVGAESTSGILGVEPGFVTIGTQNVFISYVFTLNTAMYNGTLAVQGQFGFNMWPRELAVVGGTGSFRFANSYDISEIVDQSNPADYVTVHKIYLKYL